MHVLLTRAREDAEPTAARLAELGHRGIISPVIEIVATGATIPEANFDAVVATSAHAFTLPQLKLLVNIPLYVVGERTREFARHAGWSAPIHVSDNAKSLVARLRADSRALRGVLYLAGRERKPDIEAAAEETGLDLSLVETYAARQVVNFSEEAERALRAGEVDAVLHYSRRSAELFVAMTQRAGLWAQAAALRHYALSDDVAEPLIGAGAQTFVAASADEDRLLALLPSESRG
jgi:uroporphyrinogen-III synthase